jgi:hypothetical protein
MIRSHHVHSRVAGSFEKNVVPVTASQPKRLPRVPGQPMHRGWPLVRGGLSAVHFAGSRACVQSRPCRTQALKRPGVRDMIVLLFSLCFGYGFVVLEPACHWPERHGRFSAVEKNPH